MCTNPIYRPNFSKPIYGGLAQIACPCGKCEECANVRSIDYTCRTMALINSLEDANKDGKHPFTPFFITFTYDEEHQPWTSVYRPDGTLLTPLNRYRCFNHAHLKKFKNSLRKHYNRKGLPSPEFLFTCEFGSYRLYKDKRGVQHQAKGKPHYHGIIIVHEDVNISDFKHLIEKYWKYGFTCDIRLRSYFVDGSSTRDLENCIKYVCKYVSKYFGDTPEYLKYEDALYDYPVGQIAPRVFVSNGFGAALASSLSDANYESNEFVMTFNGKHKVFKVPSYYRRKFYTTHLDNSQVILTDEVLSVQDLKRKPFFLSNGFWHWVRFESDWFLDPLTRHMLKKRITKTFLYPNIYKAADRFYQRQRWTDWRLFFGFHRKRVTSSYSLRKPGYSEMLRERFRLSSYAQYEDLYNRQYDDHFQNCLREDGMFDLYEDFLREPSIMFQHYLNRYDYTDCKHRPIYFMHSPYHCKALPSFFGVDGVLDKVTRCRAQDILEYHSLYLRMQRLHSLMNKRENDLQWYASRSRLSIEHLTSARVPAGCKPRHKAKRAKRALPL